MISVLYLVVVFLAVVIFAAILFYILNSPEKTNHGSKYEWNKDNS
jgi:beta-lactam-binding protein with PASTA domain